MAYALSNQNFSYWINLLDNISEAHANSGVALREDLKSSLDQAKTHFSELVNQFKSLRSQEKQVRKEARDLQKKGRTVLNRVRYALISQVSRDSIDSVLQSYNLDRRIPRRRASVLDSLRMAREAIARQTDDKARPSQELQDELLQTYNDLNAKMDKTQSLAADLEETRRKLTEAMVVNAELRERIVAYLISVLPEGRRDPKMMDYGLRESFRVGRRTRVVEDSQPDAETRPAHEVQPQPQPEQP